MGDNSQAHSLYIESLEWAETAKDTFLIHCSLNGIGNVYFNYKNYEKAIYYFHRSLKFSGERNKNLLGEAINTNTLGEAWLFLGNPDSALFYLNKSFNINVDIGSKLGQAICYNGIGMVYHYKGDYAKAIDSYKNALSINPSELGAEYSCMIQNSLAKSYLALKQYSTVESILNESFSRASAISSRILALEAITVFVDLYKATNKTNKALSYIQKGMQYKDSINNELIRYNSEAMSTLYKAEQQEREILILKQNAELDALRLSRQQNTFISIVVLVFIGAIFIVGYNRQRRLKNLITQVELEQKLFRTQLNPHFIFNSLSALQNFFMQNDKLAASDYLANFSRLMRNILLGSRTDSILLEKELEVLNDYLKLQQLRFNHSFTFDITCAAQLDPETCVIPPMLVQPFIENAVEHGLRNLDYQGVIKVNFEKVENQLKLTVDDNGIGLDVINNIDDKCENHISLATKIIQERLINLQRITGQNCLLEIKNKGDYSSESGVVVIIQIPYKEE